ncbi:hypothetical protein RchiOBHm_Chr6g0289371 [Rosa chinensis]|uniref:Uncharacterized protein n=1 Tax=Rosa chinensis TaxID=74649 RepID=A0A2P6PVK9_ROSCH|nr:uncharacterized protein LOC112172651 [Rosa chinensis]XP_024165847.1 uncharacterized protein LOC112172651 [Rosa chinensis]XP_024165848.1 uncharacterized protein LOC112172651 [Rosa chinensis]XP_040365646.1 uncharacterized protein LOC112172651 [Rosa chinensis]PRQ25960.1 hypothetical protein RchiOBHm_Chr6g0289371 [Rosa chinensis]
MEVKGVPYLYLMSNERLYRLEIGKFRQVANKFPDWRRPAPIEFEKVEFLGEDGQVVSEVPDSMQHHADHRSNRLFLVGGFHSDGTPNRMVYLLQPDSDYPCARRIIESTGFLASGAFSANTGGTVAVLQLDDDDDGNFYLLDTTQKLDPSLSGGKLDIAPPISATRDEGFCFQRYSILDNCWENLPEPPQCGLLSGWARWGHKLHISTCGRSHMFDFRRGVWRDGLPGNFGAAVVYKNFFIGFRSPQSIVASYMDSREMPQFRLNDLYKLEDIFGRWTGVHVDDIYMGLCRDGDDDLLWLAYSVVGSEAPINCHVRFVLFRMLIQDDRFGVPTLSLVHEAAEYLDLEDVWLCTAFVWNTTDQDQPTTRKRSRRLD